MNPMNQWEIKGGICTRALKMPSLGDLEPPSRNVGLRQLICHLKEKVYYNRGKHSTRITLKVTLSYPKKPTNPMGE